MVLSSVAQTTECHTVKNFTMSVNGSNRTYDVNGRSYIHTTSYKNALNSRVFWQGSL